MHIEGFVTHIYGPTFLALTNVKEIEPLWPLQGFQWAANLYCTVMYFFFVKVSNCLQDIYIYVWKVGALFALFAM